MPRSRTPRPAPAPDVDPLADLREPSGVTVEPEPADSTPAGEATTQAPEGLPVVFDRLWHEQAAIQVVNRWHADRIASRYAHKGGTCGCRYLAQMALVEAVGIPAPDPTQEDPEDDGEQPA